MARNRNDGASSSSTGTLTPPSSSFSITLPFKIVVEILSRLPVKSLKQLQCVCKSWKSLINDPTFAKKHLHTSATRHRVLLTFSHLSPRFSITSYPLSSVFTEVTPTATSSTQLEFPFSNTLNSVGIVNIVGYCHGMFCIQLFAHKLVILWNPSIRKFTPLPYLEYPDTTVLYPVYDFGYDHSIDTYNVVAVYCTKRDNGDYLLVTNVHTVGTNCWRRIQRYFLTPFAFYGPGEFVSGAFHWLGSLNSPFIVSFDLEKESYRQLLQPDYGALAVISKNLCVLRDCLCILSYNGTFSDIWIMNEYGNQDSWTKLFRLQAVRFSICTRALYVYENDQVLLKCPLKLAVYNSRDDTFKTLEIQDTHGCMAPQVYQESLILPCSY